MPVFHPDGGNIAILDFPSNESCVDRADGSLIQKNASISGDAVIMSSASSIDLSKAAPPSCCATILNLSLLSPSPSRNPFTRSTLQLLMMTLRAL